MFETSRSSQIPAALYPDQGTPFGASSRVLGVRSHAVHVLSMAMSLQIYIDADACPVKEETYKVAIRYGLHTTVVSNSFMQIPTSPLISRIIVNAGDDAADDWIAEHVVAGDVVVTNDIPLAARVLARDAHAIAPYGRPFTEDSIGLALAQRSLMEHIRSTGETTGGPPPFSPANRSRFLQALDQTIAREIRKRSSHPSGQPHDG
jgi:uncharacterized protein YaiI (UPF0178 family)